MLTRDERLKQPTMSEATRNSRTPDFIPLGDTIESERGKFKKVHTVTETYWASGYLLTAPFLIVEDDGRTTEFCVVS